MDKCYKKARDDVTIVKEYNDDVAAKDDVELRLADKEFRGERSNKEGDSHVSNSNWIENGAWYGEKADRMRKGHMIENTVTKDDSTAEREESTWVPEA